MSHYIPTVKSIDLETKPTWTTISPHFRVSDESPLCSFQPPSISLWTSSQLIPILTLLMYHVPAWSNHSRCIGIGSIPVWRQPAVPMKSILTNSDVGASVHYEQNRYQLVRMFTHSWGCLATWSQCYHTPPDERLRIQKARWSHWDQCASPKVFAPGHWGSPRLFLSSTNVAWSLDWT